MRRGAVATEAPRLEPEVRGGGAFSARGFAPLWFSGLCWHWGRWAIAFLASYHINQMTGSPRMVQLTGTVMWAPLLLGGAVGGVISDRFDRSGGHLRARRGGAAARCPRRSHLDGVVGARGNDAVAADQTGGTPARRPHAVRFPAAS